MRRIFTSLKIAILSILFLTSFFYDGNGQATSMTIDPLTKCVAENGSLTIQIAGGATAEASYDIDFTDGSSVIATLTGIAGLNSFPDVLTVNIPVAILPSITDANGHITVVLHPVSDLSSTIPPAAPDDDKFAVLNPTISASSNTVCVGTSLTLVTTAHAGSSYSWTPSGGGWSPSTINSNTLVTAPASDGPFTYSLNITNTIFGCSLSGPDINLTVNALPTITAISNPAICSGSSTNISWTAASAITETWTFTGVGITGSAGNGSGQPIAENLTGNNISIVTGTYDVVVTDANGCTATTSIGQTVNPLPTITAITSPARCSGSATNINWTAPSTSQTWAFAGAGITGSAGSGNTKPIVETLIGNNTTIVNGTYTVTVTASNGGCTATTTIGQVVNPLPTITAITSPARCSGSATNINWTSPSTTQSWTFSGAGITGSAGSGNTKPIVETLIGNNTTIVNGTYSVTVTASNGGCTATTTIGQVVNPLPTITAITSPARCSGSATNINWTSPSTTQAWTFAGAGITGSAGSGSTKPIAETLIGNNTTIVNGTYTVTVTANNGGCTTTTTINQVVNPLPTITAVTNPAICSGSTTNIDWTSPSTSRSWTFSGAGITGSTGSGNTKPITETLVGNNTTIVNGTYTVTVTANNGGCTATATIGQTVNPLPTITAVTSPTICSESATNINWTAPSTTQAWAFTGVGVTGNANGNTKPIAEILTGNNSSTVSGTYTVTVTALNGGCTATTLIIQNVNPKPTINYPASDSICSGFPYSIQLSTSNGGFPDNLLLWNPPIVQSGISGQTTNNVTPAAFSNLLSNSSNITASATYQFTPVSDLGCAGNPDIHTINVKPGSSITVTGGNQTLCNGVNTAPITFTSPVAGTVFNWTNSNTAIGLAATGVGNIGAFVATNPTNAPISAILTLTSAANSCSGGVSTFTITVNPTPSVDFIADRTLCNGVLSTTISLTSPVAGTTFNWSNSNPTIGIAGAGSGNIIPSFIATNATAAPINGVFTISPTANSCTGTPGTFTINVNPTPSILVAPPSQIKCNLDNSDAISVSSPVSGTTFSWSNSDPTIGLAAAGIGGVIPPFQTQNASNIPVTGVITITPSANSCIGASSAFNILVNPTPTVDFIPNRTLCNTALSTAINISSPVANTSFSWLNSDPTIGIAGAGSGNIIASFIAANSTLSPITGVFTITPTANSCTGTQNTFSITVNPTPSFSVTPLSQIKCNQDLSDIINISSPVLGTTFSWTNSDPTLGLAASGIGNTILPFQTQNLTNIPRTGVITVTPTANSCTGANITTTITVNPTPTVDSIGNFTYCNSAPIQPIVFTGATAPTTFSWTNNAFIGIGSAGIGDINFNTNNSSNAFIASSTFTVTPIANNCSGSSRTFTISVLPTPTVSPSMILTDSICSGSSRSISLISSLDASTNLTPEYLITRNFNNTNLTSSFPYPVIFTGLDSIGHEVVNNSSNSVTSFVQYNVAIRIANGTGTCPGINYTYTRGINPIPAFISNLTDTSICTGFPVTKNFNSLVSTPSTFNWGVLSKDAVLFTPDSVSSSSTLNQTINSSIDNFTTLLVDTVLITSITGNCISRDTFEVNVHPNPTITTTQSNFPTKFCSGSTMNVPLQSSILPAENSVFTWVHSNPNNVIINAIDSTGTVIDDKLTTLSNSNQTSLQYVVKVISQDGCQDPSYSETFTQLVNPTPRLKVTDTTICDNSVFVFDAKKEMTDSAFAGVYANWSFVDSALANDKFRIFNGGTTIATPKTGTNAISHDYRRKVGTNTPDIIEYNFVLTSDSGCVNSTTDTVQGDRLFLRINPTPLDFTIVSEDSPTGGYCGSSQHRMFGIVGDTVSEKQFVWSHIPGALKSVYTVDSLPKALIKTENGDTIQVIANYSGFNCFHTEILIDNFTTNTTPLVPKVVLKTNYVNNSKILICLFNKVKNTDGYQWGRTNKKTLVDEILNGQRAQEYRMPSGVDTSTFFYWVEIIQEGQTCYQRIYLNDPLLGGKSIEEEIISNQEANFVVYPNPANNIVQVDITNADIFDVFQADVYNMFGVKVMTRTIRNLHDAFPVAHMASGTYIIKITNNGALIGTQKFIKQ